MKKAILVSLFTFLVGSNGMAAAPVVFQADVLKEILSDSSFISGFNMTDKAFIQSVDRLYVEKVKSHYRFTSNGGCDIKVVADCAGAMRASDCTFTFGAWQCP